MDWLRALKDAGSLFAVFFLAFLGFAVITQTILEWVM